MESPTRESYSKTVETLFQEAASLAMRLWRQRTDVRCRYYSHLLKERFSVDSPVMQAHALYKLDDPHDHSLDGKPLRMVVHPAVLRMGTHDADKYDESQVWAKAVVWLDA